VFVVTKTNRWVYNYFGAEKERWLVKLGNRFVTQNLMHLQHFIGTFYAQESERVFGTKRYAYIDGKYYAVPRRDGLPEHIAGRPVEFFELRQDGCIFRWRKNKLQKITHE
jgi:hypothetical protein